MAAARTGARQERKHPWPRLLPTRSHGASEARGARQAKRSAQEVTLGRKSPAELDRMFPIRYRLPWCSRTGPPAAGKRKPRGTPFTPREPRKGAAVKHEELLARLEQAYSCLGVYTDALEGPMEALGSEPGDSVLRKACASIELSDTATLWHSTLIRARKMMMELHIDIEREALECRNAEPKRRSVSGRLPHRGHDHGLRGSVNRPLALVGGGRVVRQWWKATIDGPACAACGVSQYLTEVRLSVLSPADTWRNEPTGCCWHCGSLSEREVRDDLPAPDGCLSRVAGEA